MTNLHQLAWVILRETILHPRTKTQIHWENGKWAPKR